MAEKATRPRSGLQPGVAQRHERRHAGSKDTDNRDQTECDAHRAAQQRPTSAQRAASVHHQRHPRVYQERPTISAAAHQPRSPSAIRSANQPRPQSAKPCHEQYQRHPQQCQPSAIRSANLSSAHRAASAPSVAFSAHQQRPSSGVSAQQAPSAAPTERQSPRPQQRPAAPSAAPTAPDTWSLATLRAPPGARNERPPRPQQRPPRRQQRRPRGNGSASRNHIGQPLPHVSSTCRAPLVAPSAQSRH
nr:translation initiation factor IF-2-like [Drosophila suzukii]